MTDIYAEAVKTMPPEQIDNYASDLYLKVTEQSINLVEQYEYNNNVTMFKSQIDNKAWFDIPFAFTPFWKTKDKSKFY